MSKLDEPEAEAIAALTDYRCKKCDTIVPHGTHHKMESCACGFVQVDRGWYGSRVLWREGPSADAFEELSVKREVQP